MSKRLWLRRLSSIGLFGITIYTIKKLKDRYDDRIEEKDEFTCYTNQQQRKHFLSGMHEPFLTKNIQELNLFQKYFPNYQFIIGENLDEFKEKHSIVSNVQIKDLSQLKANAKIDMITDTLVVGGAPALLSGVELVRRGEKIIYLNDLTRIPISNGSAWHLEEDAQTEAPTNYQPIQFLIEQLKRFFSGNIYLKDIEKTGEFPWRTIDWIEWMKHPEHWYRAMKLSLQFQWFTMFNNRTNLLKDVAQQCLFNEKYFEELNEILNENILLEENGSIIIARNENEIKDLNQLNECLREEGRNVKYLSRDELIEDYGFIPNGIEFAMKSHDRVLLPNFISILSRFIQSRGHDVINGKLKIIYQNDQIQGGIALIENRHGEEKFIKYSRSILSLGNTEIFNKSNQRLFDVISARGVSILAHVYLPNHIHLPPVLVCGATNHATILNSKPIQLNQTHQLYLMRFTAGACITPNIHHQSTSSYDSTIALGLIQSIRKCLANQCEIHPLLIYGCNRQVSKYGQIHWFQPYQNIFIQYGAAGGGLTRAPDFISTFLNK